METSQPIVLDDALWDEVVAQTGGAMMACYQCGTCTATCPWGLVRGEPLSVRRLIRSAQLGFRAGTVNGRANEDLWLCTTCRQCEPRCPRMVEIVDSMLALRGVAFANRQAPEQLEQTLWGIYEDGNPWGGKRTERARWANGLDVKDARQGVEVLYYVGCTASYDPRLQRVARALVQVFRAAGIDFGILGEVENCCGDVVHSIGEEGFLEEIVEDNAATFGETGATAIVTTSPHCFYMFKHVYPRYGVELPVKHYTEILADLIDEGRLQFETPLKQSVTYHDPCYLGRYEDVYEAPRRILSAIPDLDLAEMQDTRANALCCGGGGGRMWLETEKGERLSDLRVEQAQATGAGTLATTCPNCIQNFEDSLKTSGTKEMRVVDVAELAAQAL